MFTRIFLDKQSAKRGVRLLFNDGCYVPKNNAESKEGYHLEDQNYTIILAATNPSKRVTMLLWMRPGKKKRRSLVEFLRKTKAKCLILSRKNELSRSSSNQYSAFDKQTSFHIIIKNNASQTIGSTYVISGTSVHNETAQKLCSIKYKLRREQYFIIRL